MNTTTEAQGKKQAYTAGQDVTVVLDTSTFEYREGDWPGRSFPGVYIKPDLEGGHIVAYKDVYGDPDEVYVDDHELTVR